MNFSETQLKDRSMERKDIKQHRLLTDKRKYPTTIDALAQYLSSDDSKAKSSAQPGSGASLEISAYCD